MMWPITETRALEPMLSAMGLEIPAASIDGTSDGGDGKCLSDTMVSVGPAGRGGTGSFVSANGLIITNHHVALDAVRQASTVGHDHVGNGFVARSYADELAGPDYEVWITRTCVDVSDKVVPISAGAARDKAIAEIIVAKEATLPGKGFRCDVKAMSAERSYVLFVYERLRDVRIVYVPPMNLGNFGGDTDNFEWPRHSADFTLLRAYVGPNGESAEPSPDNVPYKPSQYLRVSKNGMNPGDFVFLLGFPGHTMRYAPSPRLAYAADVAVPGLVAEFGRKLELIRAHSTDRAIAIKLLSAKKSLANEYKRSSGKRVMMRKLGLLAERQAEEAALCKERPEAAKVLGALSKIYAEFASNCPRSNALSQLQGLYHGSTYLYLAHVLYNSKVEGAKPDSVRSPQYQSRNRGYLVQRAMKRIKTMHPPLECQLVEDAVNCALKAGMDHALLQTIKAEVAVHHHALLAASSLSALTEDKLKDMLSGKAKLPAGDPFIALAEAMYSVHTADESRTKFLITTRDKLFFQLDGLTKQFVAGNAGGETFYPDANSTLRISAGYCKGYEAADAIEHRPLTTLGGLIDKQAEATMGLGPTPEDFGCPARLRDLCAQRPELLSTPVNCLYSTDTVGGNSGSPVMDSKGRFVGINFDRQRQGLMNEYKWSSSFSRSIGVDSRYICFLVGVYDGAPGLVDEMCA